MANASTILFATKVSYPRVFNTADKANVLRRSSSIIKTGFTALYISGLNLISNCKINPGACGITMNQAI
jgi:hypothetical protein